MAIHSVTAALFAATTFAACSTTKMTGTVGSVEGNEQRVDEVAVAVGRAQSAYVNPHFWELVKKRRWLGRYDDSTSMSGSDVTAELESVRPAEQKYVIKHVGFRSHFPGFKGPANAKTTQCSDQRPENGRCGRIAISIDHFPWPSTDYLVNTVAHENTHTLGNGGGGCGCAAQSGYRFTDTSGDRIPDGMAVWLVSYAIGDLAECFVQFPGDDAAVDRCFGHLRNGEHCNRAIVECCPSDDDTKGILDARQNTPECQRIAAECPARKQVTCSFGLPEARHE